MWTWKAIIGPIAGIIGILGFLPYFLEIWQQKTRPNRASWWIWGILGVILGFSYYSAGAIHSIWVPIGYAICQLLTAILSLRFGEGGWNRLDKMCLLGAASSILLWWLFDSPTIAMISCLVIDSLGALPTLRKSYVYPQSESLLSWSIFFFANTLNLFAIERFNLSLSAYPLYLFLLSGTLVIILSKKQLNRFMKSKFRKKKENEMSEKNISLIQ